MTLSQPDALRRSAPRSGALVVSAAGRPFAAMLTLEGVS
jgi:hypothetical protein